MYGAMQFRVSTNYFINFENVIQKNITVNPGYNEFYFLYEGFVIKDYLL